MLNAIIRFSVRNKLVIGLFTLALVIGGCYSLTRLPVDALPDITNNQVQVITTSPSLAAPEVERLITFPIEQANANIPGVVEMRSISRFGLSVVTIVFKDAVDMYLARQQVSERLNMVREEIPANAGRPELAPATTGLGEIFQYLLRPAKGYEGKYDLAELRSIQDWIVRRQLLGTPGVADVSSFGGHLKQYEVAVMPSKLKSLGITLEEVFNALQHNNENAGGAYIEKGPNALFIRTEGLLTTTDEVKQVFVKHTASGIPVYLKDVAEVCIGHAVRYGAMTYKDEGEVTGAVVLMLKGGNALQVIHDVKERIAQIKQTLPEGVVLEAFYDRTKMVNNAIDTVKTNLLEGALIVIFVLVLFLGNLRAGLVVASVIPLSMLFAVMLMNLFGVSGNLMSLGALDFGLIVDGAVIIVEAVMHRLANNKTMKEAVQLSQHQLNTAVTASAGKMMNAAVFGQIVILIVYLPVLSLAGIEGKMFRPMAQTVSFALLGAFLLSLTYVPMVSSLVLSRKIRFKATFSDKMMTKLQGWYARLLRRALTIPRLLVGVTILLFALSVWLLSRLGGEFIPELEEGDFAVDTRQLAGSSLSQSIRVSQQAAAILQQQFPEVEKIVTRIGSSEIPTDPMPVEMGDIMITLKPKKQWTSARTFDELAAKMSRALEDIPGLTAGFQFPVQMRFNELISGARQDVVCKIFGENLDSLSACAHRIGELVSTVKGATDIYVETVTGLPQIVVQYNRAAMAHYKLDIAAVNRTIRAAFAGESAGLVYENERRFELVIRLQDESRRDISDVSNLLIPAPSGQQVPLYQVATVSIQDGPNQVQRENARRRILVGFNVRGRDVQSMVEELNKQVGRHIKLPAGYSIEYGGQFRNLEDAQQRLTIAVPLALLLIFMMLYFAFGKVKYGLLIFSAIPLSAIGGIVLLALRGMPFSISAGVGFIALFGVAVLNGIVLITEFNRLKNEGLTDIKQVVMQGAQIRLRPVLMTASVASLGFLPMALSQGAGAEVQRPLATVVIGGLVSATFLTLVILPVLYMWTEKIKSTGPHTATTGIIILLLLVASLPAAQAQQGPGKRLPLDSMLQQALRQNRPLQVTRQGSAYWQQMQASAFDPGKTQLGGEYGNINSLKQDTRFFVSQSFSLPVVYKRQKELFRAHEKAQTALVALKEQELVKEVKLAFFAMADLLERQRLLLRLDSIYTRFVQAAELRLKTGESNMLEKTTAQTQRQQLTLQQEQLAADLVIWQQRLQWLLNTTEWLLPGYPSIRKQDLSLADTALVSHHPELQYQQQQVALAAAQTAAERARRSPDITLGYSNLSIIGYQSSDGINQKYYSGSDRFNIYEITLGLPLFNKAANARIKAGVINEQMAKLQAGATAQYLENRLLQAAAELKKQQQQVQYYESSGLQQAELLMRHARLNVEQGNSSYLEWTVAMNNAVTIQLNYLEAVKLYNQAMIDLEYLTGK